MKARQIRDAVAQMEASTSGAEDPNGSREDAHQRQSTDGPERTQVHTQYGNGVL